MKLQDLLVVLDGSDRKDAVLEFATRLAQRHDAHLTGFCPLELLLPSNLSSALSGYPELLTLREAAIQFETQALETARRIEVVFREQLRRNDVRGDWQAATGSVIEVVARRARTADLLVLG